MSPDVAPGWYPDPQNDAQLRYWDGAAWTEHTQQAGPGAEGSAPPGGGAGQGAGTAYNPGSMEGVPTHGRERIQQLRGGLFTSDLSKNDPVRSPPQRRLEQSGEVHCAAIAIRLAFCR